MKSRIHSIPETDPSLPELSIAALQRALDDPHGAGEMAELHSEIRGVLLAWHAAKEEIARSTGRWGSTRQDLYATQRDLLAGLSADARELLVSARWVAIEGTGLCFEAIETEVDEGEWVVRVDSWQALVL